MGGGMLLCPCPQKESRTSGSNTELKSSVKPRTTHLVRSPWIFGLFLEVKFENNDPALLLSS